MYSPGKILIVGGGGQSRLVDSVPTATAEVIDLNQATPAWRFVGSMAYRRRHLNATLLPNGQVLVTGGTAGGGFADIPGAVLAAEIWDPTTEQWTTVAPSSVPRIYHSSTLLLPDGRVLHSGSGDGQGMPRQYNAEFYSPPYLFAPDGSPARRPVIASAPASITYGSTFRVNTLDAAAITKVSLIRLGAVTHAFNQSQRFSWLAFTRVTGGLRITTPANANLAPPGYYMLFLLNGSGVPSVASILQVK
jgi:hypothetical protein